MVCQVHVCVPDCISYEFTRCTLGEKEANDSIETLFHQVSWCLFAVKKNFLVKKNVQILYELIITVIMACISIKSIPFSSISNRFSMFTFQRKKKQYISSRYSFAISIISFVWKHGVFFWISAVNFYRHYWLYFFFSNEPS